MRMRQTDIKNKVELNLAESEKEFHVKLDEYLKGLDLSRRNSISKKLWGIKINYEN